jgi:hypothetical protein
VLEAENAVKRDLYDDAKEKIDEAAAILHQLHEKFHRIIWFFFFFYFFFFFFFFLSSLSFSR